MAQPTYGFTKRHGQMWYRSAVYRLAWVALPQALVALGLGVFALGGGLSTLSLTGPTETQPAPQNAGDWGKPLDVTTSEDETNALRDKAGVENDADALATLDALGKQGNTWAAFKLGTLLDPTLSGAYPYPAAKDAKRALALFDPLLQEDNYKAQYRSVGLLLNASFGVQDGAKGCAIARKLAVQPEFAPDNRSADDANVMFHVADCFRGVYEPKPMGPGDLTAADAKAAVDLLRDPLLATFSDAPGGAARLLLDGQSPVHDVVAGCAAAKTWTDLVLATPSLLSARDEWLASAAAQCLLNQVLPESVPFTTPKAEAQIQAVKLLSLPVFADFAGFKSLLGSTLVLPANTGVYDPVRGCALLRAWALDPKQPMNEIELRADWVLTKTVSCLIGDIADAPYTPAVADLTAAKVLLDDGVKRKDIYAMWMLGSLSESGRAGIPQDEKAALAYYQQCADLNGTDCQARVGVFHEFGLAGQPEDPATAVGYYETCSAAGEPFCDARLGYVLTRGGKGVKKDLKRATTLLRSAAEGGNYWGMEQYAYALLDGDPEGAGFWMVKSIEGGNSEALDQMISNYDNGYMRDKAFWTSFHQELSARQVYTGALQGKPSAATFEAARQLLAKR